MRRFLVVALAIGLVGGSLVGPVEAKKKKKKPVPVEMIYWLHADGGCGEATTLMLTEATEGSNCGNNPWYGVGWEVGTSAGLVTPYNFYAVEGLPFVLDGTKPIVATMQVSAYVSSPVGSGVGEATLVGILSGETGGETVDLGTAETTYTVTPAQGVYEVVLEFEPTSDFDKMSFTQFDITLEQRGNSVSHGHYRTVDPASKIAVPTLK